MLNRPAKVYTGEKITASHLNDLVTYYNEIWTGGTYTFDNNHNTKNDDRRFGWGQTITTIAPAVQAGKLIVFDGANPHIGKGPQRACGELRSIIAVQAVKTDAWNKLLDSKKQK